VTTALASHPAPTDDRGALIDLFLRNVEHFPDAGALVDGDTRLTWRDYGREAAAVALALHDLGIDQGDVIGMHLVNRHEHVVCDTGALLLRALPTSFYYTLSKEELSYVAGDCDARLVVCDPSNLDLWLQLRDELDALEYVVCLDAEEVPDSVLRWQDLVEEGSAKLVQSGAFFDDEHGTLAAARAERDEEDPATIIYTSGTTGPPKGVVLLSKGLRFNAEATVELLADGILREGDGTPAEEWVQDGQIHMPPGQPGLSYLPLAHVAERHASHYSGYALATEITYVRDLQDLPEVLPQVRPFIFPAVPRVWEKFHAAIMGRIEESDDDRRRKLGLKAMEVAGVKGRAIVENRRADIRTEVQHFLFERLVYGKLREAIGLDRCMMGFSGAAPISPDLLYTFTGIGVPISEVYGMTESSTLISVTPIGEPRVGTVGKPVPGTEVKIDDDQEICFRGPNMTPGYLNKPEATAEAIDEDGWFHTGDLGEFDDAGYLKIIGRKKELIINAAGKNISPNHVEETIKGASPLIGQVLAYGDRQKYLGALIVLDPDATGPWCKSHGHEVTDPEDAVELQVVQDEIARAVEEGNSRLARVEQLKKYKLLGAEWTPESGELTPTMKLKRRVIHDRYEDEINALFE
jgi:long-chain acyl-CoA synthetase